MHLGTLAYEDHSLDIIYYPYWSEPGSNLELFAHVEVSGEIVRGDAERLAEAIVKHSDVAFISLANSPGGILLEGILIAGVVYKSRLPLQVFGNIASAASIVSVSAFDTLSFLTHLIMRPSCIYTALTGVLLTHVILKEQTAWRRSLGFSLTYRQKRGTIF